MAFPSLPVIRTAWWDNTGEMMESAERDREQWKGPKRDWQGIASLGVVGRLAQPDSFQVCLGKSCLKQKQALGFSVHLFHRPRGMT